VKVSRTAVERYLHVLRKSFIVENCSPFHRNVRKELSKMPKVYFYDSGYRNAILSSFGRLSDRLDSGAALENLFFSECCKAGVQEIRFWRTQGGKEVDFVLDGTRAFELKLDATRFNAAKYASFVKGYPDIPLQPVGWQSEENLEMLDFCC